MARPLRVGEFAPPFDAQGTDGARHSLASLKGRPFVLYFYPRDFTSGCTAQGCAFRDEDAAFRALGVDVFGVSRDSLESHRAFAARHRLPYVLLADESGAMHSAYGGTVLGGLPRRVSYLVDAEGRVAAVFDSHLRPGVHAAKMLDAARSLRP